MNKRFNYMYLTRKLVSDVSKKIHHSIICKRDNISIAISIIISMFHKFAFENKIRFTWFGNKSGVSIEILISTGLFELVSITGLYYLNS